MTYPLDGECPGFELRWRAQLDLTRPQELHPEDRVLGELSLHAAVSALPARAARALLEATGTGFELLEEAGGEPGRSWDALPFERWLREALEPELTRARLPPGTSVSVAQAFLRASCAQGRLSPHSARRFARVLDRVCVRPERAPLVAGVRAFAA